MKNDTLPAQDGTGDDEAPLLRLSLRQRLRSETRERHECLDARFAGMHAADTPEGYHRFIRMNAACHAVVELLLADSSIVAAFPDWVSRDRSAHLARDMSAMGLSPAAAASLSVGRLDLPEAIGIGYVLEGSRLGGRYIVRLVRGRALDAAWSGASFHYLDSTEEPDRFRDFSVRAGELLVEDNEIDRAVDSANACFDMFLDTERRLAAEDPDVAAIERRAS